MTQTTVTLTGGSKVNLNFNLNRKDHDRARDALESIQAIEGVSQAKAVELALCYVAREAPPVDALEVLTTKWGCSDAKACRKALMRYDSSVRT